MMTKDIFISYKNDGEGNNFSARLKQDLEKEGYAVYFNSHEQMPGAFPERLDNAIKNCKDFVIILSDGCIQQLISNNTVDWIREEVLCAKKYNKNILPILIGKAKMPIDKTEFPENIRFLADLEAVSLPEQYAIPPLYKLISMFKATPLKSRYQYVANNNVNYNVHIDFLETLDRAKVGEESAMFEIACMYFFGFASEEDQHGKINYAEASRWLKILLKKFEGEDNLPEFVVCAHIMLANMYYSGTVVREEQSFVKTMNMLEHLPEKSKESCFQFEQDCEKKIHMMIAGIGNSFNLEEILEYLEKYEMNCSNNAKKSISKFYIRYGLYERAIKVMESVNDDYPDIDYRLATLYLEGLHNSPPRPDVYRAEHYLTNAAYHGHLDAIHALGLLNFRGQHGYRQNLQKAREYFMEAAQRGHRGAQYDYAWMCKYGLGGERNIKEAVFYFEKAALQGHALCRPHLAELYQEEECRDYQKAFEWAEQAAVTGDRWGEFILGNLYFFGRGCEANPDEAVIYYQRAYNHGLYQAKFMLDKLESRLNDGEDGT